MLVRSIQGAATKPTFLVPAEPQRRSGPPAWLPKGRAAARHLLRCASLTAPCIWPTGAPAEPQESTVIDHGATPCGLCPGLICPGPSGRHKQLHDLASQSSCPGLICPGPSGHSACRGVETFPRTPPRPVRKKRADRRSALSCECTSVRVSLSGHPRTTRVPRGLRYSCCRSEDHPGSRTWRTSCPVRCHPTGRTPRRLPGTHR